MKKTTLPFFNLFLHCPRCGKKIVRKKNNRALDCKACSLHFYLNPGCAVGAIIQDSSGRILLIRRAKDPAKGKLAVPGGFIDPDETADHALRREIKEELNLQIVSTRYLTSFPNHYRYQGVEYTVLDFFFHAKVRSFKPIQILDEVSGYCFLKPREIKMSSIAFPSMKVALKYFLKN